MNGRYDSFGVVSELRFVFRDLRMVDSWVILAVSE